MAIPSNKIRFINTLILILLITASVVKPSSAQDILSGLPLQKTSVIDTIIAVENSTEFFVDSTIALIDSVVVSISGEEKAKYDFRFISTEHKIVLDTEAAAGATVIVFGRKLPIELPQILSSRERIYLAGDSAGIDVAYIDSAEAALREEDSALFKSGSLTRAFGFGTNRGLELQSGLRMQVQGQIASGYNLRAVLTDQNTPLQPEGNTRTISEIDQVYIDISGPGFSSRLGDVTVSEERTVFSRFSRKLKGVTATGMRGNNSVAFTYATTEGQYNSIRINGSDGNQGPYFLNGKNGERNIIVLAGTEKVYIDGERMTRGEDADYVIDYSSGQITFTRNRLITEYTRITVDFEYSDGRYKRDLFGLNLSGGTSTETGFRYSASYISEGDNKDSPQDITFSEADREVLSNAGDNRLEAYRDGAVFVGNGEGNYNYITDGELNYYSYGDSGDFRVSFSDVGEGNGDYEFRRLNVYEFVGKGNGRYLPVVLLPLPESQSLADIALEYGNDKFNVKSEYARSGADLNTLSSQDDGDNGGNAFYFEAFLKPLSIGAKAGDVSARGMFRKTGDSFREIDRTTEVEFDRKWNLDELSISGEEIVEFETEFSRKSAFSIIPSFGRLNRGSAFQSNRQGLDINLGSGNRRAIIYKLENIGSEQSGISDDWFRQKGSASFGFGGFTPSVLYENERKKRNENDPQGFSFSDVAMRLSYEPGSQFSAYGQVGRRSDSNYIDGDLKPLSDANSMTVHAEYRSGQRLFLKGHASRRDRKLKTDGAKSVTNLADFKLQSKEFNGGINTRFDFQVSTEKIPQKERIYVPVEEGRGYYSLDPVTGEYYPDERGQYVIRTFTTDILQGVTKNKLGLSIDIKPDLFLSEGQNSFFRSLRFRSIYRFEESSSDDAGNADEPVFERMTLTQELYIRENNEKFNVRIRQQLSDRTNNQYLSRPDENRLHTFSARVRSKLTGILYLENDLKYEKMRKTALFLGYNQNIRTINNEVGFSLRPDMYWEVKLELGGALQDELQQADGYRVRYLTVRPGFRRAFLGTGRLSGDFRYIRVDSDSDRFLPYEFAAGRQAGNSFDWTLTVDYRASNNMNITFRYKGDDNTRYEKVFHNLRAELQLFF